MTAELVFTYYDKSTFTFSNRQLQEEKERNILQIKSERMVDIPLKIAILSRF